MQYKYIGRVEYFALCEDFIEMSTLTSNLTSKLEKTHTASSLQLVSPCNCCSFEQENISCTSRGVYIDNALASRPIGVVTLRVKR